MIQYDSVKYVTKSFAVFFSVCRASHQTFLLHNKSLNSNHVNFISFLFSHTSISMTEKHRRPSLHSAAYPLSISVIYDILFQRGLATGEKILNDIWRTLQIGKSRRTCGKEAAATNDNDHRIFTIEKENVIYSIITVRNCLNEWGWKTRKSGLTLIYMLPIINSSFIRPAIYISIRRFVWCRPCVRCRYEPLLPQIGHGASRFIIFWVGLCPIGRAGRAEFRDIFSEFLWQHQIPFMDHRNVANVDRQHIIGYLGYVC